MRNDAVLRRLDREPAIAIARDELEALLEKTEPIREDVTNVAGRIRTVRVRDRVLVQERDSEGMDYLRSLPSVDAAARFVEARLAAYERMWDG